MSKSGGLIISINLEPTELEVGLEFIFPSEFNFIRRFDLENYLIECIWLEILSLICSEDEDITLYELQLYLKK